MTDDLFGKLFTHSNDAVFFVDASRDEILEVNPRACSMLGYTREELLRTPVSAIHPNEMARLRAFTRSVLRHGHGWTDELTCTRKGGQILQAEISATPVEFRGRICIVTMVRDISERKRAEKTLRRHVQRLEILHKIERGILGARSLGDIARSVVPRVREVARCDRASVVLFDTDTGVAQVVATDGVHDPSLAPGTRFALPGPPSFGIRTGELTADVQVLDVRSDRGRGSTVTRVLEGLGIRSLVRMPLIASGEVLGSVNLGWRDAHEVPDTHDIQTAREVADELAIAISHDRLRTELASRAHELEGVVADLRKIDEQRRRLLARLVRAQEDERIRIAADIHDDTIQKMTAVQIRLGMVRRGLSDGEDRGSLEALEAALTAAMASLRSLVFDLRPVALDREGLAAALQLYLEGVEGAEAITCRLDNRLIESPPDPVRTICYRIALEALANVRKHAHASRVDVRLEPRDDGVLVRIVDDGRGFAPPELEETRGHLGLTAMRERAEIAGGWFEIDSSPGSGTRVEFWVPIGR